jgi:hypothetical protein
MDCFASLAMTETLATRFLFKQPAMFRHGFAISPPISREFFRESSALQSEGAGNAGRAMRPQPRMR